MYARHDVLIKSACLWLEDVKFNKKNRDLQILKIAKFEKCQKNLVQLENSSQVLREVEARHGTAKAADIQAESELHADQARTQLGTFFKFILLLNHQYHRISYLYHCLPIQQELVYSRSQHGSMAAKSH